MSVKQQVNGLNEFLTAVYGTETRLSSLLASLGFDSVQVEIIRGKYLEPTVTSFLSSLRERMAAGLDGERLYEITSRRFGLDGGPPDSLETLSQRLGLSLERIRQLDDEAITRCKSTASRQFLRSKLHGIVFKLIASVADPPSLEGIGAKLERLAAVRAAADLTGATYEAKRAAILSRVQTELDALEAEYAPLLQASADTTQSLTAEIKNDVRRHGASVRSGAVHAVFVSGRILWDSKGLGQYAETHPDIAQYRRQGEPTVIVRFVPERSQAQADPYLRRQTSPFVTYQHGDTVVWKRRVD
jgi:hypothetical protein